MRLAEPSKWTKKFYAFGWNDSGQLGTRDKNQRTAPVKVVALDKTFARSVAGGRRHSLFLTDDNEILAAGDSTYGQLGVGDKPEEVRLPRVDYEEELPYDPARNIRERRARIAAAGPGKKMPRAPPDKVRAA